MERTLVILKPDAVQRGLTGQIITRFERRGLRIAALRLMQIDEDLAREHYAIHEGKSFYDFVNGYRVAAVKERLADQGEGPSSLLDVALACGFRSKATFNRIFKQHTGLTPTQYRALR